MADELATEERAPQRRSLHAERRPVILAVDDDPSVLAAVVARPAARLR